MNDCVEPAQVKIIWSTEECIMTISKNGVISDKFELSPGARHRLSNLVEEIIGTGVISNIIEKRIESRI